MKKLTCIFMASILSVVIFGSCSAPKTGANNGYDSWSPTVGEPNSQTPPNYQYEEIKEKDFVTTATQDSSYFSLDRNTAAYTYMRREINSGFVVNKGAVRLEEYINYFDYNYPKPEEGVPLAMSGAIFDTPYNDEHKLFTIGVAAEEVGFENAKPNNLVFLIDTSGSMYGDSRLGLIQQSFTMLLDSLSEEDTISIVTYASGVNVALRGERGVNKATIANVLQDLKASGSTNGSGGIQLAYEVASEFFIEGGNNRVILATDGDFNVGISNKEQLKSFISQKRETGIYLSVLGVGMGNTSDTFMNTLATNGNGNYAYLDSIKEAYKVLVAEMNGTFNVVAKDAKIGVKFNADVVESYRLIGYESKTMTSEEFNDQQKDAGEIGSGHKVTAVYELILKEGEIADGATVAQAEIRYKEPESGESCSIDEVFTTDLYTQTPSEDSVFIGCVVEFGLILRQSQYRANAKLINVIERLEGLECIRNDQFKAEFLQLVIKANAIETYEKQTFDEVLT